jgi:hypothetical protein
LKPHAYNGKKKSDEEKARMSEIGKARYVNGFVHPMLGKKCSPERVAKIRAAASLKRHAVRCVETKVQYPSISEAGRQLGIDSAAISGCVRGTRKTAQGYHWEYVNPSSVVRPPVYRRTPEQIAKMSASKKGRPFPKKRKPVTCVETGQVFVSLRAAAAAVGVGPSKICRALKLGTLSANCHWRYFLEPVSNSV